MKKNIMSQNARLLAYMRDNGGITCYQAWTDLGISRLSARIADLRADGIVIVADRIETRNPNGMTVYVHRYSIPGTVAQSPVLT